MNIGKKNNLLLRQFNITHSVQIKLSKIKVPITRTRLQRPSPSHRKIVSTCNDCDSVSFSKRGKNNHQRNHKGTKLNTKACPKCPHCKRVFAFYNSIYRHVRICKLNPNADDETVLSQREQFKCKICAFSTVHKYYLKKHLRTHSDERPFPCIPCSKSFKSYEELRTHNSRRHSGENKNFPCPLCSKYFHTRHEVKIHIPTHTGERPFKCQFCEQRFKWNGSRTAHVKVCKGNPKQRDKEWVKQMKKYKCHLCDFASVQKGGLTDHFRTHTGERRFNCGLCNFKCSTQFVLNCHVRVHTGEKPFKCSECTYSAASSSAIRSHFKRNHGAEPRQKDAACSLCSKRYYSIDSLKWHMKLQHRKKAHYS